MDNFLTELGIKHEVTNSYTPEMNGVAERFNLTALDGFKTLLNSSEVPHKFWGEALLCFTYAWNRICHKDSNKTPFEKYSGRKPSVLRLKPFGCLAYAGVPKQIRKKFDMRAKMGIMMGYAQRTKGYRIWLIDEDKLVETINGFSDLSEQQEALMVEVTIPNCYKQAIRSRDASKWHDANDKEINVMMERKVWDLVDHPDNIKILENRWVYTIKYNENNKIVRYKARLVARGVTHNYEVSHLTSLRIIGKGHSAARKLCSAINVKSPSKTAFKYLEKKLEHVSNNVAYKTMNEAAAEIHEKNNFDEVVQCVCRSMELGNVEDICL
ncbi:retrovirus-related Pol polyprotein from transposon TNT 1-94 [Trichonephila clavipes]|nr:retrovirus-related Pol polyprotein from transposon TNT 1-94 [Trichonephila clavipes]